MSSRGPRPCQQVEQRACNQTSVEDATVNTYVEEKYTVVRKCRDGKRKRYSWLLGGWTRTRLEEKHIQHRKRAPVASSTHIAGLGRAAASGIRSTALKSKKNSTRPRRQRLLPKSQRPSHSKPGRASARRPSIPRPAAPAPPPAAPHTHRRREALRNGPPWHGHHIVVPVGWRPMNIDVCVDSGDRNTAAPVQPGTHCWRRGTRGARAGRVVPPGRVWRRRRPTIARHGSAPSSSPPTSPTRAPENKPYRFCPCEPNTHLRDRRAHCRLARHTLRTPTAGPAVTASVR